MKALVISEPGKAILADIAAPAEPGPGEVAIDLAYVGYCGSDLTSYRGLNPLVSYPRVPGHEISGTVAALGEGVSAVAVGDRVTVLPYFNCGECRACKMGRPNACVNNQTMGVQREGAMTARVVVPEGKVIPLGRTGLRDGALIEPCSVGFHAVRRADVQAGETVLVLGCGMIGLGAMMGSIRRGATVIAVDLSEQKLEVAKKLGAAHVLKSDANLAAMVEAIVPGGPDVVIEAVGAPATFLAAVDLVGQCGRVVYIGYAKDTVAYDTKRFITKEIDVRGSRNALRSDFDDVIDWLGKNPGAGDLIVTAMVGLDEAPAKLAEWDQRPGDFTKILVQLN
jgi:threonine dehydrogenase-like Zn-dependent dehydrogenase